VLVRNATGGLASHWHDSQGLRLDGDESMDGHRPRGLSKTELEYLRVHGGTANPEGATTPEYERLVAETERRIQAAQMSVQDLARLLNVDEPSLTAHVINPDLVGLIMSTPQTDLRWRDDGPPLTPLEWLKLGGSTKPVWDLLTTEISW
jgi:hypothetical protein